MKWAIVLPATAARAARKKRGFSSQLAANQIVIGSEVRIRGCLWGELDARKIRS